jgi:hypothetical protein
LLAIKLSGFNVRDVPRTAAKAQQQALSLPSVEAWLYQMLQEGAIEHKAQFGGSLVKQEWQPNGLVVSKDDAYAAYEDFSTRRRDYRPSTKSVWSKRLIKLLGASLMPIRHAAQAGRVRSFRFAELAACRDQFASKMGADFEWESYEIAEGKSSTAIVPSPPEKTIQPSEVSAIAKDIGVAESFANRRME